MKPQPFKTALAIAFLLALFAAAGTSAQNHPVRVSVKPGNNTSSSQAVSTRLAGKIGATSRYALVTGATDIVISADCLPAIVNGRQLAITCHTTMSYFPIPGVAIDTAMEGYMAASDEADVVQTLFDSFVRNTSDEKLAAITADFKRYLNLAIAKYPQGVN